MKVTRHFARRFRLLKVLRGSLALGALADGAAALALVVAPAAVARAIGLAGPSPMATPAPSWGPATLFAALLIMLAGLWIIAARDPRRYSGIVLVAIVGRLARSGVCVAWAAAGPEVSGLWPLAAVEAGFGLVHAATWIPLRV